jgi:hypothetical protein
MKRARNQATVGCPCNNKLDEFEHGLEDLAVHDPADDEA